MNTTTLVGLTLLALILGIRHGIDWDHIAAITDLIGGEADRKKGFKLAMWYALGHELVLIAFGGTAILLGWTLPKWMDVLMERFVGLTLLLLAGYFIVNLFKKDDHLVMASRWRLLMIGFYNIFAWATSRWGNRHKTFHSRLNVQMSGTSAFSIGIVHGIGAETPTQLLMFATASGLASPREGMMVVLIFVLGLLLSHIVIATVSLLGFISAMRHRRVMRGVAGLTAFYSLLMGLVFTFGHAVLLPAIL